jgi:spore coat protein JC
MISIGNCSFLGCYPYYIINNFECQVGTEELAHVEIVSSILYQLTKGMSEEQVKASGIDTYFVDHTAGIYPQAASGMPFSTSTISSTGDVLADLHEDLAAEQKARVTYDNILRLVDDPDVRDPIKFLRQREINHYQRFAESLGIAKDALADKKNFYYYNPAFDKL